MQSGEIVGIAGVSGNGQKELLAALSGESARRSPRSRSWVSRRAGCDAGARGASSGSCFVPEERLGRGAVPQMSLADNALLTAHDRHGDARA